MGVILVIILWGMVWESTTISSSRFVTFWPNENRPIANTAGDIFNDIQQPPSREEKKDSYADETDDDCIDNGKCFNPDYSTTKEWRKGGTPNPVTETHQTDPNKKSDRETTICNNPQCNCTQEQIVTCKCDEENKIIDLQGVNDTANITELQVKDCSEVTVGKKALFKLKDLKRVTFENITQVIIETEGIHLTSQTESDILFRSSGVCLSQQKSSFRGFRGTLTFENVTFECPIPNDCFQSLNLTSFAIKKSQLSTISKGLFNTCKISTFELSESIINDRFDGRIQLLAVEVIVKQNRIGSISGKDNRAASNGTLYLFLNNDVRNVYEKAFILNGFRNTTIKGNVFHYVQHQSFDASQSTGRTFTFTDNEFKDYEKGAIVFSVNTKIGVLKLSDKCGCNMNIEEYLFSNAQNKYLGTLCCLNQDGRHTRIQKHQERKKCGQIAEVTDTSGTGPCRRNPDENGKLKVSCQCKDPNSGLDLYKFDVKGMKTEELSITGCEIVVLRTDLFMNLTAIEKLTISSVKEVNIEHRGLFVPFSAQGRKKMKVHVEFSTIVAKSEAFGGFLGEIHFHNVSFSNIMRATFIDIDLDKLEFLDSNLDHIRFAAFKNCNINHMKISSSKLNIVEPHGLRIHKVTSFSFTGNEVGKLNKEAFNIKAGTVHFQKNIFKHAEGDAFKAIDFSSTFTFEGNEIESRDKNVLKTLRPSVVNKLILGDKCSCPFLESIKQELNEKRNESIIADNMTQILLKAIECHDGPYISLAEYELKSCKNRPWNYILPFIVIALIFFLAFISVICILRYRTIQLRKKQKRTEKLQEQITSLHLHGPSLWGRQQRIEEEERKMNTMAYPNLLLNKTTDTVVTQTSCET